MVPDALVRMYIFWTIYIICNTGKASSVQDDFLWKAFRSDIDGELVNKTKLIEMYSTVCPVDCQNKDKEDTSFRFASMLQLDCRICKSKRKCLQKKTCPPNIALAYLQTECVNTIVYPNYLNESYYMVGACPLGVNKEQRIKCEGFEGSKWSVVTLPVTSAVSNVTYRNKFCALCNGEKTFQQWEMSVQCPLGVFMSNVDMMSISEIKRFVGENYCKLIFTLAESVVKKPPKCPSNLSSTYKINKCNLTGLWDEFDADLNWACENFRTPFGHFANVFCFLCNPSVGALRHTPVISECNVTGHWKLYDEELENSCWNGERNKRFGVYKNVFCLLCNGIYLDNTNQMLSDVTRKLTTVEGLTHPDRFQEHTMNASLRLANTEIDSAIQLLTHIVNENKNNRDMKYKRTLKKEDLSDLRINTTLLELEHNLICGVDQSCTSTAPSDTSVINTTYSKQLTTSSCYPCVCNTTCLVNDNCCLSTLVELQPYSCVIIEGKSDISSYLVSNRCSFPASESLRNRCETNVDSSEDILSAIPIKGSKPIPYRNIHCWQCSNEPYLEIPMAMTCSHLLETALYVNITSWLADVMFYCTIGFNIPSTANSCLNNTSAYEYYAAELNFHVYEDHCNEWFGDDISIKMACDGSFTLSNLPIFVAEETVYKNVFCYLCEFAVPSNTGVATISTCNVTGRWDADDKLVRQACTEYPRHARFSPFKNFYCRLCNLRRFQVTTRYALPTGDAEEGSERYRRIFSLNPDLWKSFTSEITSQPTCENGTYDTHVESCRPLYCAEGRVLNNGSCIPLMDSVSSIGYRLSFNYRVSVQVDASSARITLSDVCSAVQTLVKNTTGNVTYILSISLGRCTVTANSPCIYSTPESAPEVNVNDTTAVVVTMKLLPNVEKRNDFENLLFDSVLNQSVYMNTVGGAQLLLENSETSLVNDLQGDLCEFIDETAVYPFPLMLSETRFINFSKLLVCPRVRLAADEYILHENSSQVELINRNSMLLKADEYIISDNMSLLICQDNILNNTSLGGTSKGKRGAMAVVYDTFSYVCTFVSIGCLLGTLLTYCMFPTLRTLPGKMNMILATTLLGAQASLQFGLFLEDKASCIVAGILIHFFWMSTFCAMNVCSFHMFRVFRSMSLRDSESDFSVLISYVMYIVFLPVSFIAIVITVAMVTSHGADIGYGRETCFISHYVSTIVTFIAPASLIFITNIAFFGVTFHKIRTSPTVQSNAGDKRELVVYAKLCTITGIAWPIQIVDAVLPLSVFSFIATFVNALQGLFIFVSYVCNHRVFSLYRKLCHTVATRKMGRETSQETQSSSL